MRPPVAAARRCRIFGKAARFSATIGGIPRPEAGIFIRFPSSATWRKLLWAIGLAFSASVGATAVCGLLRRRHSRECRGVDQTAARSETMAVTYCREKRHLSRRSHRGHAGRRAAGPLPPVRQLRRLVPQRRRHGIHAPHADRHDQRRRSRGRAGGQHDVGVRLVLLLHHPLPAEHPHHRHHLHV